MGCGEPALRRESCQAEPTGSCRPATMPVPPQKVLSDLKARIRAIERAGAVDPTLPGDRFLVCEDGGGNPRDAHAAAPSSSHSSSASSVSTLLGKPWRLGAEDIDARLGSLGLERDGVHEIKPEAAGGFDARAFALALAARRLMAGDRRARQGVILWCEAKASVREHGMLHGEGLELLGIGADRLLIVEPAQARDVLWAMEEALGAGAVALVAGQLDEVDLTPARRLALAAARGGTACLLITHARSAPAAATATRWRVGVRASAPHPFDPAAPGAPRFAVTLERCRSFPPSVSDASLVVEWSDVAYRFRMAAAVADRAHDHRGRRPAGGTRLRAG